MRKIALLLALLLALGLSQVVLAETKTPNDPLTTEEGDKPADENEDQDGPEEADKAKKAGTGDTTVNSDWIFLTNLGAVWKETTHRGGESWQKSGSIFLGASVRNHLFTFDLDRTIRFDAGVHVQGGWSDFESKIDLKYVGEGGEIAGGLEFYLQDTFDGGSLPRFSLETRILFGYSKIRGSNDNYRAKVETTYAKFQGILNILWPFEPEGDEMFPTAANFRLCDVYGIEVGVTEGFTPKIELRWDWKIPLHVSKRSSVTRGGGRDRAYEDFFRFEVWWHIWRHATDTIDAEKDALWEFSWGIKYGFDWKRTSGYVTKRDGIGIFEHEIGGFLELMYNRMIGSNLVVTTTFEVDDRREIKGMLNLFTINF